MRMIWFAFILLGLLPGTGFALSTGAKDCRLLVKSGALDTYEASLLKGLGFSIVSAKGLDFSNHQTHFKYFPTHADFAYEVRPDRTLIQLFPNFQNSQISHMLSLSATDFHSLRSCDQIKEQQRLYAKNRKNILTALGLFKKQTTMGEALIRTEQVYEDIRKKEDQGERALKIYNQLLQHIRSELRSTLRESDPFKVHDEVRKMLFNAGMKNYCRSQASLTEFMMKRCGNCSAQTKLVMAIYSDLGLEAPEGWEFGAEVFKDHVRPVLVHYGKEEVLDLVYNTREKELPNPVMKMDGVLRQSLKRIHQLRPALFMKKDGFTTRTQAAYRFHPVKSTLKNWMAFVGMDESETALPQMDKVAEAQAGFSNDVTLFDVPSENNFSNGPVPERADLSDSLGRTSDGEAIDRESRDERDDDLSDEDPANEDGEGKYGLATEIHPDFKRYINRSSIQYVQKPEADFYQRLVKSGKFSGREYLKYTYHTIKDFRPKQNVLYSGALILPPVKINLGAETKLILEYEGRDPVLVLEVSDQTDFIQLESSSTSQKHNWIYRHLTQRAKSYAGTGISFLTEFFGSPEPLEYWRDHHEGLIQAQKDAVSVNTGFALFCAGCITSFDIPADRFTEPSSQNELARAQIDFYEYIAGNHREVLDGLQRMDDPSLVKFFKFFKKLPEMRFTNPSNTTIHEYSKASGNNIAEVFGFPLTKLLEKMLFDSEYLYTTKLTAAEKRLYGNYFETEGLVKKAHEEIQLPKVDHGFKCPASGGRFIKGAFLIECPVQNQEKQRTLVELNPLILSGLFYGSSDKIFLPTWASLIFYSWRENHHVALEELKKETVYETVVFVLRIAETPNNKMMTPIPEDSALRAHQYGLPTDLGEDREKIFWHYVDALLAPNVPIYSGLNGSNRFVSMGTFEAALASNRTIPQWVKWDPLFEKAYDFYLRFRPRHRFVRLLRSSTNLKLVGLNANPDYLKNKPHIKLYLSNPSENRPFILLVAAIQEGNGIFLQVTESMGKFYALPMQVQE